MSFFGRLAERVAATGSIVCVGLDPRADTPGAARDECLRLVAATAEVAAAFKPNAAFFEQFGPDGTAVLGEVIEAVPDEVPVLLDAKRGDIGSTATAYARAVFEVLGADAVTLSPYLGRDSIEPFLEYEDAGVFLLCRTSNPGGADLQDRKLAAGGTVFEQVARMAAALPSDRVGMVVGATVPKALARVRAIAPEHWILAPGVGAQGGSLEDTVAAGRRPDGLGLLLPVSRAVAESSDPKTFVETLNERAQAAVSGSGSGGVGDVPPPSASATLPPPPEGEEWDGGVSGVSGSVAPGPEGEERNGGASGRVEGVGGVAAALFETGCLRFGEFTLKSGVVSPVYLDLRTLVGHPAVLRQLAGAYVRLLLHLTPPPQGEVAPPQVAAEGVRPQTSRRFGSGAGERAVAGAVMIAGVPLAGLPIATAVAVEGGMPMVYPRPPKDHGTGATVEGPYQPGDEVVVVDDVATSGTSILEAAASLREAGLVVRDAVVLVDRGGGAREALRAEDITLHPVTTLGAVVEHLAPRLDPAILDAARAFLAR